VTRPTHEGPQDPVAVAGLYQDIVKAWRHAVCLPGDEIGAALARGAMDGIITFPGGWGKNVQDAPSASLSRDCCSHYFLTPTKRGSTRCRRRSRRPSRLRARRLDREVGEMQADDAALSELVSHERSSGRAGRCDEGVRERTEGGDAGIFEKHARDARVGVMSGRSNQAHRRPIIGRISSGTRTHYVLE